MFDNSELVETRLKLTERDLELARALALSVRYMTAAQIKRCWWPDVSTGSTTVEKRLKKLVDTNWLESARVFARPLPEIVFPIRTWKPGDRKPEPSKDSWKAKSRWKAAPKTMVVYYAGRRASHSFLGKNPRQVKQPFQIAHDLGVAEVFVLYRTQRPVDCHSWIGEIQMPKIAKSRKRPDAAIGRTGIWPPDRIVEFAGCYGPERLTEFYRFCESQNLPFELW